MDAIRLYNRAVSGYLAIQASFLLLAPSMVVWMLSPEGKTVTSLETFMARSFATALLLISFLNLLFSGEVQAVFAESVQADVNSPYASPTLYATLIYNAVSCIMLYTYSYSHALSSAWLTIGSAMHLILAASGMLLLMFGQGPGHVRNGQVRTSAPAAFPSRTSKQTRGSSDD